MAHNRSAFFCDFSLGWPVLLVSMVSLVGLTLAGTVSAADSTGSIALVGSSQTYLGRYSTADATLSVEIDGLVYRGSYAANSPPSPGATGPVSTNGNQPAGAWGSAFLFATSASVLQCRLDSAFPQASGQCLAADGRRFALQPAGKP